MTIVHELKCWPEYFDDVASGRKPFEVRHDDRGMGGYQVGNLLHLREYDHGEYTGREAFAHVTYVYPSRDLDVPVEMPEHVVVLGLELADASIKPRVAIEARLRAADLNSYTDLAAAFWLDWTERAQPKRLYPNADNREGVTDFSVSCTSDLNGARAVMERSLAECSGWRLRQGFQPHDANGVTVVTWRIRFEGVAR